MKPDSELRAWIERNSEHLFLSVVTVLDLSHGLTWLRHHRATEKASRLEAWIDLVCFYYHARILPVDIAVALRAGALITAARGRGASVDTEDAVIAATA